MTEELEQLNRICFDVLDSKKQVLNLDTKEAMNEIVTGGKGSSLAQMISLHLEQVQIPKGIVVTTNAFESHLNSNQNLKTGISQLQKLAVSLCAKTSPENGIISELQAKCERYLHPNIEKSSEIISLAVKMPQMMINIKSTFIFQCC